MRRFLGMALWMIGCAICIAPAVAFWQSRDSGYNVSVGGGGAFVGIGDIITPRAYWGLRAYSSANRGSKAINVCNVADAACADFLTDATTGALVVTTVGGSDCSVVVCTVKTVYEQIGTANCVGAVPCDITQATISKRPTLALNATGGRACLAFALASSQELVKISGTLILGANVAQPYTHIVATVRTGNTTTQQSIFGDNGGSSTASLYASVANNVNMFAGSTQTNVAASDNTFHSLLFVYDNAGSPQIYVNGASSASPSVGANAFGGSGVGSLGAAQFMDGKICELAFLSSAISAGNAATVTSNQRAYWGF